MKHRQRKIIIRGAGEHNLQGIDLEIPRDRLVVITGVSGSGKSSLAFDTLYAEGQRRYVESLSAYARQFLGRVEKPRVDYIGGLSPAIAIEQKSAGHNPRSTVGTVTEIYDYLRVLFARAGVQHCPACGDPIASQSAEEMTDRLMRFPEGTKMMVTSPVVRSRKGAHKEILDRARTDGFVRVLIDGVMYDLDEQIDIDRRKKHDIDIVVDRLIRRGDMRSRLADSVETALALSDGLLKVVIPGGESMLFSEHAVCLRCGRSFAPLSPQRFSFNSPLGMCLKCGGLGTIMDPDPELIVRNTRLSLNEGAVRFIGVLREKSGVWMRRRVEVLARRYGFTLDTPWRDISPDAREVILYGDPPVRYPENETAVRDPRSWAGIMNDIRRLYLQTKSEGMRRWYGGFIRNVPCPACGGTRLNEAARAVRFQGISIDKLVAKPVSGVLAFFDGLKPEGEIAVIAGEILNEIGSRLRFLADVGLHYLTLDRAAPTLSGGEAQRIRLASQIGSGLMGVMYILDEPSIGLHARDTSRLLKTLKRLRDAGNTVIVVEHDPATISEADYVVDMGPGAGHEGGRVVVAGTPSEVAMSEASLTGKYLSGRLSIPVPPKRRRRRNGMLRILDAHEHNLKHIDVSFPLSRFICVTGVSGSGKSTLVNDILYRGLANKLNRHSKRPGKHAEIKGAEHIDRLIKITQKPIGRTPRSNPATYTKVFTHIRNLFARLPEARLRGYTPGRFSFNVKGGRCEACRGDGLKRIEMHFLPDVYVTCDVCKEKRFNRETLEVRYRGLTISDVLNLEVREALEVFSKVPSIVTILKTLDAVGLAYIKLGQPAPTLSGGEAQRVKLSRELAKQSTGRTLYILDEPTTGLHSHDILNLLQVLHQLVDKKNTVVVIEHNMDVIKNADYIIDLGPEGGDRGGYLVSIGTPEEIAADPTSYTGRYLARVLHGTGTKERTSPLTVTSPNALNRTT